jgi:hypothetical protein
MKNDPTKRQLRNKFKKMYLEEFDDPNEAFMEFLLYLIPKDVLIENIKIGKKVFYSYFQRYKK